MTPSAQPSAGGSQSLFAMAGRAAAGFVAIGLAAMFVSAIAFRLEHPSRKVQAENPELGHGGVAQGQEQAAMGELMGLMGKLQQNPDDVALLLEIGHRFLDMGSVDRAEMFSGKALAAAPRNPEALNLNAQVLSRQQKFPEAEQAFQQLLAVSPQDGGTHYNLGILYRYHLKQPDKARGYFEKAAALSGGDQRLKALAVKELEAGK